VQMDVVDAVIVQVAGVSEAIRESLTRASQDVHTEVVFEQHLIDMVDGNMMVEFDEVQYY